MITTGDWVIYLNKNSWLYGAVGYVKGNDGYNYDVQFTRDSKGEPMWSRKVCSINQLKLANAEKLTEESYRSLMDIALATRDYEWCKQLTEQYNRTKVREESCTA